jgi:peptidoglycan hydrolase-like protein with peptidoglycan-binding domain
MPTTIQNGSHGPEVRAPQRILVETKLLEYEQIDGQFGARTKAAVEAFQSGAGLPVDGVVGRRGQDRRNALIGRKYGTSAEVAPGWRARGPQARRSSSGVRPGSRPRRTARRPPDCRS